MLRPSSGVELPHQATTASTFRVAIQEQVQFPTHQGVVSAQRVRVFRIKQSAAPPDRYISSHLRKPHRDPAFPKVASGRKLPSQPLEMEC
jgi:hypothetical protein